MGAILIYLNEYFFYNFQYKYQFFIIKEIY
jgi:hypothetical protein